MNRLLEIIKTKGVNTMKTLRQVLKESDKKELINSVIDQLGMEQNNLNDWDSEDFGTMQDISNHSADDGWSGFTYYNETISFYEKNRNQIVLLLTEEADEFGETGALSLVKTFNCIKRSECTEEKIAQTLYGREIDETVANGLAWYALEYVSRLFQD